MARYLLVGSQDPTSRIDRVVDGSKTLELGGDPVALSDAQYARISQYARLEPVQDPPDQEKAQAGAPSGERSSKSDKGA